MSIITLHRTPKFSYIRLTLNIVIFTLPVSLLFSSCSRCQRYRMTRCELFTCITNWIRCTVPLCQEVCRAPEKRSSAINRYQSHKGYRKIIYRQQRYLDRCWLHECHRLAALPRTTAQRLGLNHRPTTRNTVHSRCSMTASNYRPWRPYSGAKCLNSKAPVQSSIWLR